MPYVCMTRPYVWGPAAMSHYSLNQTATGEQKEVTGAGPILSILDSEKLLNTAFHFPLRATLDADDSEPESGDYDPRFLLSVFATILAPGAHLDVGAVLKCGAMSLIFASLSSECEEVRGLFFFFECY